MSLSDREYVRGEHPSACTCVSCERRRASRLSKAAVVEEASSEGLVLDAVNWSAAEAWLATTLSTRDGLAAANCGCFWEGKDHR